MDAEVVVGWTTVGSSKTTRGAAHAMEEFFAVSHPSEIPQWVWTVADGAARPYAEWLSANG